MSFSHEHSHEHTCEHNCEHTHEFASGEEKIALLKYMAEHNAHHAEELHEISHGIDGEASHLLHEAVDLLSFSAKKINEALKLLEG